MVCGQEPETFPNGKLVLCPVVFVQVAPIADNVPGEKHERCFSGELQCFQGSRSCDDLPEIESSGGDDNLLCQRRTLTG